MSKAIATAIIQLQAEILKTKKYLKLLNRKCRIPEKSIFKNILRFENP